ncbi:hypothetical protein LTR99_001273 [Exophiala xenobiotica]|uniref:AB hydrolase-1 domain-containing protein n=1 Tax=Vermiconidia calcicola TaxID=1690605 RepID=A0AAV9QQY1_9PEZI|nr:hypothetical protein LTR96_003396 [Exophiala xenobiotica]KAK5545835.1 hypothetical protein LTR25_000845 [Vermiconidia calcicola]KAK5549904.1 hypothetical protein LTR23_000195 [Chaetothyriales sp. CCFEE 6169]KAK5280826.1 hypothetical protein LTR40_005796 [Exophiala xenobiotica]KAK5308298.1 hypothetical protein LTR99_001273 [Exophiala xenobiotica]
MSSSSPLSAGAHTANINNLTIHYKVLATSPNLPPLIIHPPPWGVGADIYVNAFARLSSHFTLIIPSPRGNDSSDRPADASAMSTRHVVADLDVLRSHLGLERMSLIGHSSGGTVALGYAIKFPERVDNLVLIETDLLGYQRKDVSFFADVGKIHAGMSVGSDAEFREFVLRIMPLYFAHPENGGPEAFEKAWTSVPSLWAYGAYYGADQSEGGKWDQVVELDKVKARTLVIVGRQDRTCGVEVAECVAAGVQGSSLEVFEECGHFPWVEQQQRFWDGVESFLKA